MTREEAIERLSKYVHNSCYTIEHQEACAMAIAALRGQEERSNGCYRCNTFDKERKLQVNLLADFCPQCGRRLEET